MIELPSSLALTIGHASSERLKSGVTIILPDQPAIASCHIAGGSPGTRETDLLSPENTVEAVDAIVLSGGSAFGLAAADGAATWLAGQGRGFTVGDARVPIVPAAILFDLLNGGDKSAISGAQNPYSVLGRQACEMASRMTGEGSVGAGTGATLADVKGGFGTATATLGNGATLTAFVAVNAAGSATFAQSHYLRAAMFEKAGEFGGYGLPADLPSGSDRPATKGSAEPGGNTTIAVIATDLPITKAQLKRLAIAAHDGIALAVYPAHTPLDGDTIFTLTTSRENTPASLRDMVEASALSSATLARAIARGVAHATPAANDIVAVWSERRPRQ